MDRSVVSILVDEEMKVRALEQFNFDPSKVSYASQDEGVATVQPDGTIRGIASGKTKIVVTANENPNVKGEVTVIVSPSITAEQAETLGTHFKTLEDATGQANAITAMAEHEVYCKTVYKNDVLHSYICENEVITASIDDAYFSIYEDDSEIIADEGSVNFKHFEMIFHTNEFYDTLVFKQTGETKNYLKLATQSYMSDGNRAQPVLDIMDNWFTAGNSLFSRPIEDAQLNHRLTKLLGVKESDDELISNLKYGSRDDSSVMMSYTYRFDDPADADDERNYGIPAGTPMTTYQTARFAVENDRMVALSYDLDDYYEINGDQYHGVYSISFWFEPIDENKTQIRVPDREGYTRVDSIFDL